MTQTLTRRELVSDLRNQGLSISESELLLSATLDAIVRALSLGNTVELPPLGRFEVHSVQPSREWRFGRVVRRFKNGKRIVFIPQGL